VRHNTVHHIRTEPERVKSLSQQSVSDLVNSNT
jgi:hypothetical protein